jgi:type IV secretion system protein TrbL
MDGVQFAFLNQLLDTFRTASVTGMVNLKPAALGLVTVLGILDVTAMWGLYFGEMRVREIMGKVIKIGFFVILILNWGPITTAVEDTFVKVGQIASAHQTATKPSSIMVEGTKKMYRLWNNAIYDIPMSDTAKSSDNIPYYDSNGNLNKDATKMVEADKKANAPTNPFSGLGESIAAIPGRIIKIILALAIFIAFAFIALNVLLCFVEFYLTTALSIILLPFGVNSHTSFISQKALGAVVNFGVKLMIMIFLLGLMSTMISKMDAITNDDYGKLFEAVLQACMYAFLIWKLPSLISGMLSGTPSMGASASGVVQSAATAAGAGAMTTRFMGAGSAAAFRGMANASRISGDAIRAGGVAAANSNTVRGAIFNSMRGTANHLGTVTKGAYRHQINAAKNSFINAVARENTASTISRKLSNLKGYKRS